MRDVDERAAMAIAQREGVADVVGRLLAARAIAPEAARGFLNPSLRSDLPDPSVLQDMDKAAERLGDAVRAGETIGIFGDYDVDGATSSALLARAIRAFGGQALIHIPDRIKEGYGPNSAALLKLKAQGASVIITTDCGTQAHGPLGDARDAGIDVIVCDHHQAGETVPPCYALVNPNQPGDHSGLGQLAAVGVAFLMMVAVNRALRAKGWYQGNCQTAAIRDLLPLTALGTVADVVPLKGVNRALVSLGLKAMASAPQAGLKALMAVAGLKDAPTPYHLGFLLGPRVNAGGRVGLCHLGADLLTTDDPAEAARIAAELDRFNRERQAIEALVLEEALEAGEAQAGQGRRVLMVASESWHPGVIGIVAGRLKDRFGVPALVVSLDAGIGKGSGRSVEGADLGQAVRAGVDAGLIAAGGGHAMAAGLTLEASRIQATHDFLEATLGAAVETAQAERVLSIDAALTAKGLTAALAHDIAKVGPFGAGFPEPQWLLRGLSIVHSSIAGGAHVRFVAADPLGGRVKGIAFRACEGPLGEALLGAKGRPLDLVGQVSLNAWNGTETAELQLRDAAFSA